MSRAVPRAESFAVEGTWLALETSSRSGSVALATPTGAWSVPLERARAHAVDLVPAVDALMEAAGRPALERVVVGTGPGSYTGLRVGAASAIGIARGTGAQVEGLPSFHAWAFAALEPGEEGSVLVDARAGAFYFAHYRRTADGVTCLIEPCAADADTLRERLPESGVVLAGEDTLQQAGWTCGERLRTRGGPSAIALLQVTAQQGRRGDETRRPPEPLYLRSFGVRPR